MLICRQLKIRRDGIEETKRFGGFAPPPERIPGTDRRKHQDGVAKKGGARARLPLAPVMKIVNEEPFRRTQSLDHRPAR